MQQDTRKTRIWELDFFRGIALIAMIYFHVIYDMNVIYGYDVNQGSGINFFIGKFAVILFMLLAGVSSSLSRSNIKRGVKVLGIAMVITIVTHAYGPQLGIKFGVLHYFGVCMLLAPLFNRLGAAVLAVLGTGVILLDRVVENITVSHNLLFPLGIHSSRFFSSDYYPLIPWMGIFLYGMAISKVLYSQKKSVFNFSIGENIVSKMGRNTLIIYIVHQPVIIAVLEVIKLLGG
ncbi:MAG: DUF1624 domain-containing protein [Clostridia bacterium]|nr:DUF1624 domain-containing protein [Clostridia bacterium]